MLKSLNSYKTQHWLLGLVLVWVCVRSFPEIALDRIDPYDGALFAANGGLFLSLVNELGKFLANPVDWLYGYFNQYPALAVRRHPPLFGFTEMLVYLATGVSVFGAKVTAFLYSIAFAIGIYALSYKIWKDPLLAAITALMVMTTPQIVWLGTAVRLDMPSVMFSLWAIYHYVEYMRSNRRTSAVYFAAFSVLSLYTYQLPFFIIGSACLHLIWLKNKEVFRDKTIWLLFGILAAFLVPLLVEQIYVAMDNITASMGGEVEEWKRFHPIQNRYSFEFFIYYIRIWFEYYPVQLLGMMFWAILVIRRKITQEEVLLLLAGLTAFAFFTWTRGKDHRYAFYIMIPLVFLAAQGFRDFVFLIVKDTKYIDPHWFSVGVLAICCLVQSFLLSSPAYYLTGMSEPVSKILTARSRANILYSGPRDAAFIFYTRQYDVNRGARVHRATVQVDKPSKVADFIKKEKINVIAWESGDERTDSIGYGEFRSELERVVRSDDTFKPLTEFKLDYWAKGKGTQSVLNVFVRQDSEAQHGIPMSAKLLKK